MLTLLHNPHRLCLVSSRFCTSSACSSSSRSFSLFWKENDSKAHSLPGLLFMVYIFLGQKLTTEKKIKGHSKELSKYLVISLYCFFLASSIMLLTLLFLVQSVQSVNLNLPFTCLQVNLHQSHLNEEGGEMYSLEVKSDLWCPFWSDILKQPSFCYKQEMNEGLGLCQKLFRR